MRYKNVKYFDCQDMPENVKNAFFVDYNGNNDIVLEIRVYGKYGSKLISGTPYNENTTYDKLTDGEIIEDRICKPDRRYVIQRGDDIVSDWFMDNGAELYEKILVKHWW